MKTSVAKVQREFRRAAIDRRVTAGATFVECLLDFHGCPCCCVLSITFSYALENLDLGRDYFYRFMAQNDAGAHWSPTVGKLSAGTFSFKSDSWVDIDLLLWLDASDINADGNYTNEPFGGIVDEWRDKSGGYRHATNGYGPKLLFSKQNQKSVLSFDGESQYLRVADYPEEQNPDLDIQSEGTLFLLIKVSELQNGASILSKGWNDSYGWIFKNSTSNMPTFGMQGTEGLSETSSNINWSDNFSIFTLRKTSDKRLLRMNGTQSFDFTDFGTVESSGQNELVIGALDSGEISMFAKFEMAELHAYMN